ncbi:MAG: DUF5658 family protein [Steroidobacteraceae bacterium]
MAAVQNLYAAPARHDQRRRADRRTRTLRALVAGNFNPRRYGPRRVRDASLASTDRFDVRWVAIGVTIMLLSAVDALLTLRLLQRGALEANPVMAAFLHRFPGAFVDVKIGLTAGGVVLLVMLAKVRAFGGRLPVGSLLYAVLATYVALVGYEVWILRTIARV